MLPSPEAQSDPTEDSTTTSGRPRGKLSSPHQIGLALFGRVAGLRTPPPDRALWREATELILRTVDLGSLQVSELLVQHVLWGLYFLADAAGRVTGYTEPDLASAMHCSRRQVHNVLQILSGIAVRRTRKSRRAPVEYHLNLGGLDWPAVRRRAALEWRDRLRGSRGLEPEPGGLELGPSHAGAAPLSHAGAAPLSPAGAAPLGPSHAGAAPLSPAPAVPPKSYVRTVRTVQQQHDLSVAAEYLGEDRGATEQLDRQQQHLPLPTTTSPSTPPPCGEPDAATEERLDERDQRRFEGLVGVIATLTRLSGRGFDAEDEVKLRRRFNTPELSLADLQRHADALKAATAAGAAAPPRPVRRRRHGERPDLSDAEYVVWEASGRDPGAVRRYRDEQADAHEPDGDAVNVSRRVGREDGAKS